MSVVTMPAKSRPNAVVDKLNELTDGSFEVVAVEVFDHPEAVRVDNGAIFGGDGGPTTLGFWVLGKASEVQAYIEQHGWDHYTEQYSAGYED